MELFVSHEKDAQRINNVKRGMAVFVRINPVIFGPFRERFSDCIPPCFRVEISIRPLKRGNVNTRDKKCKQK